MKFELNNGIILLRESLPWILFHALILARLGFWARAISVSPAGSNTLMMGEDGPGVNQTVWSFAVNSWRISPAV